MSVVTYILLIAATITVILALAFFISLLIAYGWTWGTLSATETFYKVDRNCGREH